MAVAQGYGKTVTSGSVFAYDTGDTRNSYIGEPTVNIHTDSENVSNWTGNLFGNWINSGVTGNAVVAPNGTLTGDIIGDGFGRFNASSTATPGQAYTYSVYLKNVTLTSGFYIWYAFGLNGALITYGQALFIPITSINNSEWTRFSATITAPSSGINQVQFGPCPFIGYNYGSTYSSPTYNASGTQLAVWGGQIEQKSHVTPYTAGTRSTTQGLLPLVGNSTIDLTNVSFDSNAQMTFDGTNDYIAAGNPTSYRMGTSNFTLECVMKQSKTTGHCLLESRGDSLAGYLWVHNYGTAGRGSLFLNYGGNQYVYLQDGGYVATTTTQYYHMIVIANRSAGTLSFYVNGNKAGNDVSIHSNSISPSGGDRYWVGADLGGSPWQGEIPVFKHYNRALSAGEVRQNYLHYKTRFNLS